MVAMTVSVFAGFAMGVQEAGLRGQTLEAIHQRGHLLCGVDTGLPGFAEQGEDGVWRGFDADLCRAYAAAFLGRADAVRFVPLTTAERFEALAEGRIDILIRNTSWTFDRDVGRGFDFPGVAYYDGQGFLAPADLGVASARDLSGARVCVQDATTTALNLADFIENNRLNLTPVVVETAQAGAERYRAGGCDVITNDLSSLAGLRARLPNPAAHVLLPDIISKEPLGPVIREGDSAFGDAARWVLHALIAAEEFGVTAANAREFAAGTRNAEARRMLGAEGDFGERLGLHREFALRAVEAGGNYGEIFARNLGTGSPLGLRRGLNAQWTQGGLMYAPPFR
ncbi:MAG: amino acid ABC transporter substrate-binding protein [Maricaulaceae bacterium]|nr:amino acid ABC transporter substrate-binding protein [Maricaulaceae bacterium]